MTLTAIAAMASNRVIGSAGDLPWRIPEDFKFFKDTTTGHIMIMGRKTFEATGLLKNRLHVVITRQKDYKPEGAIVVHSVDAALDYCRGKKAEWGEEVFIIGGGEIYREMLPLTDRIILTEIKKDVPGDTKFPDFSRQDFREVERRPGKGTPEGIAYDFVIYERTR